MRMSVANWRKIAQIEDGCGGTIYKVADAGNSGLRSFEIAMCVFPAGETATRHVHHRMEEAYFVIEGEGEVELDGKWYPVKTEDCIAIPIGTIHRMRNTSTDHELRFVCVNAPNWLESDSPTVPD